jgi:hypothetical protein
MAIIETDGNGNGNVQPTVTEMVPRVTVYVHVLIRAMAFSVHLASVSTVVGSTKSGSLYSFKIPYHFACQGLPLPEKCRKSR